MTVKTFTLNDLLKIEERARTCGRQRAVHVFHPSDNTGPRTIANCLYPESYCQPHLHPSEYGEQWIYCAGPGICLVIFDKEGNIAESPILNKDLPFLEIPPNTFHTGFAIGDYNPSTMFEISQGPYNSETYKQFAPWAPSEQDAGKARKYLENLERNTLVIR